MIRGLLLDYGGVIKDFERPTHPRFEKIAAILGHNAATLEGDQTVVQLWAQYIAGETSPHDYAQQLLEHLGHPYTHEAIESLARMKEHQPFPDMIQMTASLRRHGLTVGLMSNVNKPIAAHSRAAGDYEPFDFTVLSAEVGERKPHAAMYMTALREFGNIDPHDVLYVDDTPRHLVPAARLGMRTLLATIADRPLSPRIVSSIVASGQPIDFP